MNKRKNGVKTSPRKTKVGSKKIEEKIKINVKGKPAKRSAGQVVLMIGLICSPLMIGVISTFVTGSAMMAFGKLNQPPLAPPAWLFPLAWTILYILMGVASYLLYRRVAKDKHDAKLQKAEIIVYFVQLFFNYMWTIIFFRLEMQWLAFGWLTVMWCMIIALIVMCAKNCKSAAWCLAPYVVWCTFAMYLNIMIAILN